MHFSEQTRHYFETAQGFGELAQPTHQGQVGSRDEGLYFEVQLQLDPEGQVLDLAFFCPRCLPAIACGGYLYRRLLGQSAYQEIPLAELLQDLGGLPPQRSHYAWMALEALSLALKC